MDLFAIEAGYLGAMRALIKKRKAKKRRLGVLDRPWASGLEVRAHAGWNAAAEALMPAFDHLQPNHTRTTHQCDTAELRVPRLADKGRDPQARVSGGVITQLQSNSATMDG